MCDATSETNDRLVKVPVFQPGKLTVFQSKFKAVVSIKGFAEAFEPGFESRLPNKEMILCQITTKTRRKRRTKSSMLSPAGTCPNSRCVL